ncbi:MAG: hypothetical protein JSV36_05430 [Anaerolineae bacterium]|nr:MAG: hypothetical protein JSV36_05430 [Anaerolineae bacterium]
MLNPTLAIDVAKARQGELLEEVENYRLPRGLEAEDLREEDGLLPRIARLVGSISL